MFVIVPLLMHPNSGWYLSYSVGFSGIEIDNRRGKMLKISFSSDSSHPIVTFTFKIAFEQFPFMKEVHVLSSPVLLLSPLLCCPLLPCPVLSTPLLSFPHLISPHLSSPLLSSLLCFSHSFSQIRLQCDSSSCPLLQWSHIIATYDGKRFLATTD